MSNLKQQRLLIISPHPDDEVLGCGGLIKRIKDEGGKVYILFLTVGNTNDFSRKGSSTIDERKREIEKVAKFLRYDNYHLFLVGNDYHLKLDLLGQKKLMDIIEKESPVSVEKVKPTIVAFPSVDSYNQDHRISAIATHAALRPSEIGIKHNAQTVLSYEEPGGLWSLENLSKLNFYVQLTKKDIDTKLSALKLYKSQMRPFPNPRSFKIIETLAVLRGSQCGVLFAEGFTLHKMLF